MTFLKLTKTNRAADPVVVAVDAICSFENCSEAKCTRVYCIDGFWHEVRERIPDIIKAMEATGEADFSASIEKRAEPILTPSPNSGESRFGELQKPKDTRIDDLQGDKESASSTFMRETGTKTSTFMRDSSANPLTPSLEQRPTPPIQMSFCPSFKRVGRRNQRGRDFRKRIKGKQMPPPGVESNRPKPSDN